MILSIGMIVKNEKKYLERCLTALKPVLDSMDSELIIADTGSTDNTVEIAKKFTNKVFHFDWINDFAAARNSTLDRASGEWYMFIDADEIIQNCTDLINFFNSGEYKTYSAASFIIRSYIDLQRDNEYTDFRAPRLVRKDKDTRFEGTVHEGLSPIHAPAKHLNLIADHYGYAYYENGVPNGMAKEKSDRNIKILSEELARQEAEGSVQAVIYDQIADCCDSQKDYAMALEYVNKGFEKTTPESMIRVMFYGHKFRLLLILKQYAKVIALGKEYFNKNKTLSNDCYAYAALGIAYSRLGENISAIPVFASCFELYSKYTEGKLETEDLLVCPFRMTLPLLKTCYKNFLNCCILENKFDVVNTANELFPLDECLRDHDYMSVYLSLRVDIMENIGYDKLEELYFRLDEPNRKTLLKAVRRTLLRSDRSDEIMKRLETIAKDTAEFSDVYEILRRHYQGSPDPALAAKYAAKHSARDNEDILCVIMLDGLDIAPFITAPDFDSEKYSRVVYGSFPNAAELFADYDVNKISAEALEKAMEVYVWAMVGAIKNKLDMTPVFEKFGQLGQCWRESYPDVRTVESEDILAAVMAGGICSARAERNYELFDSQVSDLIRACPSMAPFVNEYAKKIQAVTQRTQPVVNPEFAELAAQVKRNIRDMIAAGDLQNAESTLAELEELCPLDPEIELLKDKIYTKRTNEWRQ